MIERVAASVGLAVLVFCVSNAYAARFGAGEHIRFVADTTLTGPSGERLYLARKLTMHSFGAPYSVDDDGFVLGVFGDTKKYYPLPPPPRLKALQDAGYLPNPLPPWEMDVVDYLFGHALWLLLAGVVGYAGFRKIMRDRRNEWRA